MQIRWIKTEQITTQSWNFSHKSCSSSFGLRRTESKAKLIFVHEQRLSEPLQLSCLAWLALIKTSERDRGNQQTPKWPAASPITNRPKRGLLPVTRRHAASSLTNQIHWPFKTLRPHIHILPPKIDRQMWTKSSSCIYKAWFKPEGCWIIWQKGHTRLCHCGFELSFVFYYEPLM